MTKPLRVLLVSSGSGSRGGGEIFLEYLARGLSARGHEVIVWIPSHPRMDELAAKCADHARIVRADYTNTYDRRLRSLAICFNHAVSRKIAADWAALQPDVIHVNKQNLEDGLDLLRAAGASRRPALCTIHLTQSAKYLRARGAALRDWISRREIRAFGGPLVAVLEARRRDLAAFLGVSHRTLTVLNGVPQPSELGDCASRESQREALGVRPDELLIMAVGRLVEQKRPFRFLEIAHALHGSLPHARFVWVGDGELAAQWRQAVVDRGMSSYVACTGWRSDAADLMAAADVFLHVAEFEGLPLAIAEAMARGIPCALPRSLADDIGIFDESNALLVDDMVALTAALTDRQKLRSLGANAKRLAIASLSSEAMTASYERIYADELLRMDQIDGLA